MPLSPSPAWFPHRRAGTVHRSAGGFSLIEVTLAMGIASFALLVIFSMLPTGMATTQSTGRQVTETEIFNRIGSELATTPVYSDPVAHSGLNPTTNLSYDTLYNYGQSTTGRFPAYFDIEGNELQSTSPNIAFTVQCSIENAAVCAQTNQAVWAPFNNGSGIGELRWATIRIGFHKDPGTSDSAAAAATPDPQITKRTFLLSNRGT